MAKNKFTIRIVFLLLPVLASFGGSVRLSPELTGNFRWKDAADNLYSESYRTSYSYSQAAVIIDYEDCGARFAGRMVAVGLKPNFAYQMKIEAEPGSACAENLGRVGRWWCEEWRWTYWYGWNLNNKGDGIYPTPNDLAYEERKDVVDLTSPTGLKYRLTPYLLFAYFFTDQNGDAIVEFKAESSYHVLWSPNLNGRIREEDDGPLLESQATPRESSPAYEADGVATQVGIFGEWERLPMGETPLPDGDYEVNFLLTEESFHQVGENCGYWTKAMSAPLQFRVGKVPVFTVHPQSCMLDSGDELQLNAEVAEPGGVQFSWLHNGTPIEGADSATLRIPSLDEGFAGTYQCVAGNEFGSSSSQAAVVFLSATSVDRESYETVVDERNALVEQVAGMFTVEEVAEQIALARPDSDGDGFTDAQEDARGTDPTRYEITLAPGWNLISLARIPEDNTVATIFAAAGEVEDVWIWNRLTLSYERADSLEPNRGHWLYWDKEEQTFPIHLPEH